MRLRSALLAATVLAVPVAAKAQPVSGLYVGAGAGMNVLDEEYLRHSPALGTTGRNLSFHPGFVGEGSVGYGLGNGLRLEIEGDYYSNNLHHARGTDFPTLSGGVQTNYGAMFNALYDLNLGLPVVPYIGVGAGYQWTNWSNIHSYSTNLTPPFSETGQGLFGAFAYQGIIGIAYQVPQVPGLAFTADYRFMGVLPNERFHGASYSGANPVHQARGNQVITSDYNNSILLGIRYNFGQAPMAPPPAPTPVAAPAPAPARTYLVFFDWDKANLTGRARQIIGEAARASTRVATTRIEVNGYTDLSGTAQYNQGLSVRRADAVAAELVRDGVPRSEIAIRGFGETHPLVPTAQGVREPQNRRVEIILR